MRRARQVAVAKAGGQVADLLSRVDPVAVVEAVGRTRDVVDILRAGPGGLKGSVRAVVTDRGVWRGARHVLAETGRAAIGPSGAGLRPEEGTSASARQVLRAAGQGLVTAGALVVNPAVAATVTAKRMGEGVATDKRVPEAAGYLGRSMLAAAHPGGRVIKEKATQEAYDQRLQAAMAWQPGIAPTTATPGEVISSTTEGPYRHPADTTTPGLNQQPQLSAAQPGTPGTAMLPMQRGPHQ